MRKIIPWKTRRETFIEDNKQFLSIAQVYCDSFLIADNMEFFDKVDQPSTSFLIGYGEIVELINKT